MTTLSGRMINGAVVLDRPPPPEWVEGQEVTVSPGQSNGFVEGDDLDSLDQSDDPESIERWIAAWAKLPKLVFTPKEEAEWLNDLEEQKVFALKTWDAECRKIEELFP